MDRSSQEGIWHRGDVDSRRWDVETAPIVLLAALAVIGWLFRIGRHLARTHRAQVDVDVHRSSSMWDEDANIREHLARLAPDRSTS